MASLPVPLQPLDPPGSLIYETSAGGSISAPAETDGFTIDLDDGQTLAVVVDPDAALIPKVEVLDPGMALIGTATAASPGEEAVIQAVATTGAGTYTLKIDGQLQTAGAYTVCLTLNAALEEEEHAGPANDDPGRAEDLDASFIGLGSGSAQRGAVLGSFSGSDDWYRFVLEDGQSATLALEVSTPQSASLQLYDGQANLLAMAAAAENVDRVINGFVDATADGESGAYLVRVAGQPASDYTLLVTRDADFDTEPNADPATAQVVPEAGAALGYLGRPSPAAQAPTQPAASETAADDRQFAPGRLIVRFADSATKTDRAKALAAVDAKLIRELPLINAAVVEVVESPELRVQSSELSTLKTQLSALRAHSAVLYAEPDYLVHAWDTFPNDPFFPDLWGLHNTGQTGGIPDADVDAPQAWDVFSGSSSVVVADIDTGVDYNHEDLAANMWVNPGEIPGDAVDNDGNGYVDDVYGIDAFNVDSDPMDDHSHGTHTAGTIGAVGDNGLGVAGVNWNVQIMALKFLNAGGSGSTADAVACIEYMTMMKTDYGVNVVASNNSWGGGGFSQALKDAIEASNQAGILFVAAAGNGDTDADVTPHYPSSYDLDGVISVAASDHGDQRAGFSNYGATSVDLAAPGVDVLSTIPNNRYDTFSGTSMAAPHVAGAVAVLGAYGPNATASDLKAAILDSVDALPEFADVTVSGGRLNLAGALETLGRRYDNYRLVVEAGDTLRITTVTPAGGPYEFVNSLDPAVQLYDPHGTPVARDDNSAPDGRNALLTHEAAATGVYTVRVMSADDSTGEYVLGVSGHRGGPPAFAVSATDPVDGLRLRPSPGRITVDFNDTLLLTSLTASDLTVDGVPAAGVTALDHDTARFDLPEFAEGPHQVSISGGAVLDVQGTPIEPYAGTFFVDLTGPRVIASSVAEADVAAAGTLVYTARFDEQLDAAGLETSDVALVGRLSGIHRPQTFDYDPITSTLRLRFAGVPDDLFELTLPSGDGQFEDTAGNDLDGGPSFPLPSGDGVPGGDFVVNFIADVSTAVYPAPLEPADPLGSLVHSGSSTTAVATPGDTDTYTIDLDDGQTITLVVDPVAVLQPTIELFDPSGRMIGDASSDGPGRDAVLQTVQTTAAGTYRMTVGGAQGSTGVCTVQVVLGAAVEAESHDGPDNDSPASAQDLDTRLIAPGAGPARRGAVLGTVDSSQDWYRFTLGDGESATLGLKVLTSGRMTLDLYDAGSTHLAAGTPAENLDRVINNFVDTSNDGSPNAYFARLSGMAVSDYNLLVTCNADFDTEPNDDLARAQDLGPGGGVLGHLGDFLDDPWKLQQKLTAPDAAGNHLFGRRISISGNTAIIGASNDRSGYGQGRAYVFRFEGVEWTIQQTLTATDDPRSFGSSVHVNGDVAIIGAERGRAAYVFRFDGTQWVEEQKLTGFDTINPSLFGSSVAIHGDAAVVGAMGDDFHSGAAYTYRFDGSHWIDQQKLSISGRIVNDDFGTAVALENDMLIVGAPLDSGYGAAYVYRFDGTRWVEQQKLTVADPPSYKWVGSAVALDGDNALIGSRGVGYLFQFDGTRWVEQQRLEPSQGSFFFARVAIHGDSLAIGLPSNFASRDSEVHVYHFNGTQWVRQKMLHEDPSLFGSSVAVGGDTVMVGASWDDHAGRYSGSAFVYQAAKASDAYAVHLQTGQRLVLGTATPAGGPGLPVNQMDPMVELYDPAGTLLVRDDNGIADGRNALLVHTAGVAGTYTVRMAAGPGSRPGQYVLNRSGDFGPFQVAAADPADGAPIDSLPVSVTLDFNAPVLSSSLDAADLTVDGVPAARVNLLDANTAVFDLPIALGEGVNHLAVAAGSIADLQDKPIEPFAGTFVLQYPHELTVSIAGDENDADYRPGDLSLREALAMAAVVPGDQVIQFDRKLLGQSVTLDPALGPLIVDSNVVVQGRADGRLTVDAGDTRAFDVVSDVEAAICGLTLSGGGVRNAGTLTLCGVTITASTANGHGGAVLNRGGSLTIANSTVSGNSTRGRGGGIYQQQGRLTIVNSTISANRALNDGGGIYVGSGTATLHNTIMAGNHLGAETIHDDAAGAFDATGSHNLIGVINGSVGLTGNGTLYGTSARPLDAMLAPPADYGGTSLTHALLPGSPAIDAGGNDRAVEAGLVHDQRGFDRFADGKGNGTATVDVGAFEFHSPLVVTTPIDLCNDDLSREDLSLREALGLAATIPGDDVIRFDAGRVGQHIALDQNLGQLVLDTNVDVQGPQLAIWGAADRVLYVAEDVTASISGLTISSGRARNDNGGGIYNDGTLTVTDSIIQWNDAEGDDDKSAGYGGGVYNAGRLTLRGVIFSNNETEEEGGGGGIYNAGQLAVAGCTFDENEAWDGEGGGGLYNAGTASITDSTFSRNYSERSGGGIYNTGTIAIADTAILGNEGLDMAGVDRLATSSYGTGPTYTKQFQQYYGGGIYNAGQATLTRVTISGNEASYGGGVYNHDGVMIVADSTISANEAWNDGGGILNSAALTVTNTTISANRAPGNHGDRKDGGHGGGIYNEGPLSATNVTIAGNSAGHDGGGIHHASGTALLHNTIVAGNLLATGPAKHDVAGTFDPAGSYNLIGVIDGSTGLDGTGTLYGTAAEPLDAMLGPLQDNGGPSLTHALLPGSPAVDAASNDRATEAGLTLDQRGFHRFVDGAGQGTNRVDVGAYELGSTLPAEVVGRHVFYNDSAFDGNDPAANDADDAAIAVDKQPLLPGQTASFANYSSYSRGINGIMIDVRGLYGVPTVGDLGFRVGNHDDPAGWNEAPPPSSVTVRRGEGIHNSDRLTITWPHNVIQKQWLQVTVLPTANTGLAEAEVFYFGNAIGETGSSATDAKVGAVDVLGARDNQRGFVDPAPIDFDFDFNRDQRTNSVDMLIARDNTTHFLNALKLITVPAGMAAEDTKVGRETSASQSASEPAASRRGSSAGLAWLYEFQQISLDEFPPAQTAGIHQPWKHCWRSCEPSLGDGNP